MKVYLDNGATTQVDEIKVMFSSVKLKEINQLEKIYGKIRSRKISIKVKEIYPKNIKPSSLDFVERRVAKNIPSLPFGSLLITDKIYLFGKSKTFCIEKKEIIEWFLFLFETVWNK